MHDATPRGAAVLTAVIFFDEINRDQKGFATGDGAIIVGGFFKQRVRESTYAKASLGTFPPCDFPKVTNKMLFITYTIIYIKMYTIMYIKMYTIMYMTMFLTYSMFLSLTA